MESCKHIDNAIFVFVYNDYDTYHNDPHIEECFDDEEVAEILDSVRDLFDKTFSFGSEEKFIRWCYEKRCDENIVFVYTMAQRINGYSRRTLIPSICEYYGFVNINANAYISAIGCNKKTLFKLLEESYGDFLAPTLFIDESTEINYYNIIKNLGQNLVFKPISESCCIDNSIVMNCSTDDLNKNIKILLDKYGQLMIQRYIPGKEIGITIFWHLKKPYALTPIELVLLEGNQYLKHIDSFNTNYDLKKIDVTPSLLSVCEQMSKTLEFECVSRFDFRLDNENNNYYLFDISPNPTVNGFTSSNWAAQEYLNSDYRSIFRLMVYEKFLSLEPSFDGTK